MNLEIIKSYAKPIFGEVEWKHRKVSIRSPILYAKRAIAAARKAQVADNAASNAIDGKLCVPTFY